LEATGYERCPDARFESKRVSIVNSRGESDFALLFRIHYHETKVVETCDGKVFCRIADKCVELKTDQEKHQMRIDKGEVQHEQEPCTLVYPDDFNLELVNRWAEKLREVRGLRLDVPIEKLLEIFHLGRRRADKFQPNIACMLIFAKDPVAKIPGCRVEVLRFDGTAEYTGEKRNTVKEERIRGCIPYIIEAAARFISGQIRTFHGLGKDNRFQTLPEYPESAWHEALVNACVHRSYHIKNTKVFVRIFDDRFEVESPGPFPPLVNADNIYDTQHSRNPFIMDALQVIGLVKGANEGVKRMRETMLEMKLPAPEFAEVTSNVNPAKVKVVLRNNIVFRKVWLDSDVAGLVGASIFKTLSKDEKMILNCLAIHDSITVNRAQVLTQHNWHTSKKLLVGLVGKGIIVYIRKPGKKVDRQSFYKLNDSRPMNGE
jgi:ATP-dependent DNA helicase RecG